MTFDIHLHIDSHSPEGHALEGIINRERVSPEEAIRNLLKQVDQTDPDNLDHLFTPEMIADLRSISAEIKAGGKTYTMEEVDEHFVQRKKAWLASHQR